MTTALPPMIEHLEDRRLLSGTPVFTQTNLVSDGAIAALHTDPSLLNPWGMVITKNEVWVTDAGAGVSEVFNRSGPFGDRLVRERGGWKESDVGIGPITYGVGNDSRVVLYSIGTAMWATRFWWMLQSLGFDAFVLDGGLDKWKAEARAIETGPVKGYPPATFTAKPKPGLFIDKRETQKASTNRSTVVVNALGPQFHKGLEPSRYGRPGRIPGSVNVPAATLIDAASKTFLPPEDVAAKFAAQGITKDKRVVAYCGGGISATIDLFQLHRLGYDHITLYDGSMGEWAKDTSLPIETD